MDVAGLVDRMLFAYFTYIRIVVQMAGDCFGCQSSTLEHSPSPHRLNASESSVFDRCWWGSVSGFGCMESDRTVGSNQY